MKHIIKIFNFGVLDYKDAEILLNQMKAKGYVFKSTGKGWIKGFALFEKSKTANPCKYTIDVRCGLTENDKERYYDFYKDLGWLNKDCFRNKLHIFASEQDQVLPLYTDEASELENLKSAIDEDAQAVKHFFLGLVFLFCIGLITYFGGIGLNRLASYSLLVYMAFFFVYSMIQIILSLCYRRKCRQCMESGDNFSANKLLKEVRAWYNFVSIASFIFFPAVAIFGYFYAIWGQETNYYEMFGLEWSFCLFAMSVLSVPLLLTATYLLFLYPKQAKFKALSYIGYFMYYISIYVFFSATYLIR